MATTTTKHSLADLYSSLRVARKDTGYMRAVQRTDAFWTAIQAQFCPHIAAGDVLIIPGQLYRFAVAHQELLTDHTPLWIIVADSLAGDLIYYIPGGSDRIMALGLAQTTSPAQAIPAPKSRFIDLSLS